MILQLWFSSLLLAADISPGDTLLLATHAPSGQSAASRAQIDCIMKHTQQPYQLLVMPWRRAKQEVKMGRIDGYFTAMPNNEIDSFARLSAPLFLENWYWFWRADGRGPGSDSALRYGAILGSHQADWFMRQGIKADVEVGDISQLLQLLAIGRIDILLADLDDVKDAMTRLKLNPEHFNQRFFRYVPLGSYFSRERLQQRPGFLRHFNAAVHLCATAPFALAASERDTVLALLLDSVRSLARQRSLLDAVGQQNQQQLTLDTVLQRDRLWQQAIQQPDTAPALARQLLALTISGQLRQWQQDFDGLVTEVILMDNQGANVAISQLTTDYWQGDETPFLSVFNQTLDYFVDVVEYDQSAQRFQVKLSVPVKNAEGYHIGALSIGIDVERALAAD
ncbi:hypothetical protein [Rheinheimera nanhaiensis]|uniref:Solute-binding protein family 3/N-terminal domain-containing protein n=1 Tax=Rheinheimera nanhaiensis E407-8 TaxID=562729 RepID=I1DXX3_9GAMM|nr:hypothetical protein [Rheinheimera nanhaiensis]GAB58901.1 hypothetical protein RNAN_1889 [Rheinheimera nanhaiensis E407-8]